MELHYTDFSFTCPFEDLRCAVHVDQQTLLNRAFTIQAVLDESERLYAEVALREGDSELTDHVDEARAPPVPSPPSCLFMISSGILLPWPLPVRVLQ